MQVAAYSVGRAPGPGNGGGERPESGAPEAVAAPHRDRGGGLRPGSAALARRPRRAAARPAAAPRSGAARPGSATAAATVARPGGAAAGIGTPGAGGRDGCGDGGVNVFAGYQESCSLRIPPCRFLYAFNIVLSHAGAAASPRTPRITATMSGRTAIMRPCGLLRHPSEVTRCGSPGQEGAGRQRFDQGRIRGVLHAELSEGVNPTWARSSIRLTGQENKS